MPFSTTSLADWECLSFFLNNAFTTRIRQHNRVKFEFKSITFTMLSSTGRYQLFNYLYLLLVITTIHLQGEKIFITMGKCNFNDLTPKRKCWTKLVRLFLEENYITINILKNVSPLLCGCFWFNMIFLK